MISGDVLKYRKGFFIRGRYETLFTDSSPFPLTMPFDLLAETTAIAARSSAGSGCNSSKNEIWLAFLDTVRTSHFDDILAVEDKIPQISRNT